MGTLLGAGAIEQLLKLINNIIEGTPLEQRNAQALQWFFFWWPILKPLYTKEQQDAIEDAIKGKKP